MLEDYFMHPRAIARHRKGVFGTYIDSFAEHLDGLGYQRASVRLAIQTVGRFGEWLKGQGLGPGDVSEATITAFNKQDAFAGTVRHGCVATLYRLLDHLRSLGVAPAAAPESEDNEAEQLVEEFGKYLLKERSLSEATVQNYAPVARLFVAERFGKGSLDLPNLCIADLHGFVSRHARGYCPKRVQLMLSGLRSFLRFLYLRGNIASRLYDHVLSAPGWRQTKPPEHLKADEIERVLAACDQHSAIGQRDYAILLLLARLGLRAGEVVALELEDIRWESGAIYVCGKGRHRKRFPLPEEVGKAVAVYLKSGRPRCDSRRVFLRNRAPYRGFKSTAALDTIVQKALLRVGLDPPLKGPHLFRHSLATNMLHHGATLTEIGQILHHANPNTTSIYAKVDITGLRALALPWPEDRS